MNAHHSPMQRVIAKCWEDDAFKERLLADPAGTLAAEGVEIPEGVTVNVAVDTEATRTLVIPWEHSALGDAALADVYGGKPNPMPCVAVFERPD
jgi:hypothetical protein